MSSRLLFIFDDKKDKLNLFALCYFRKMGYIVIQRKIDKAKEYFIKNFHKINGLITKQRGHESKDVI